MVFPNLEIGFEERNNLMSYRNEMNATKMVALQTVCASSSSL